MNLRARLRTTSAVWTAPVWVGIVVFYFFHALHLEDPYEEVVGGPLWAPDQVAQSLFYFYPFAYALTCGLAVWEGGRLRRDGVWDLAPGRSRNRVAAHTLAPVVAAGWLILGLPVAMRLIETRLLPTPAALAPLLLGMGLVVAWAVIGCALGHLTPRLISAPLSAVVVYYLIVETGQVEPVWLRHVSGAPDTVPDFGEQYKALTLLVPFLFTASAAASLAVWWLPATRAVQRRVRSATGIGAVVVMVLCAHAASGWGYGDGPISAGHAAARCTGTAPRVCVAETGGAGDRLEQVRNEIVRSLGALRQAGVNVTMPETVSDNLLNGRRKKASTRSTWWLPLSQQAGKNGPGMIAVRYGVLLSSVRFPCAFPTSFEDGRSAAWVVNHDAALLWAATVVDADEPYVAWRRGEYGGTFQNPDQVLAKVEQRARDARKLPAAQQTAWFHAEQAKACRLVQEATR
ncbi:hypothetical protein JS756_09900 [Streptomyces actuosus]|uniref:ABC transporter permease n=1 Tax=Streptomyces actuosus TaxID=1885 RepID=A0ABS2VMX9_STRAS|nr:hypothetical protein [Streptomyces actuosus]MBN0044420.1 hypothetical protein [Streptomyces actuosus]